MLFKRALAMYGKHFSFTVAKHRYKRVFFFSLSRFNGTLTEQQAF